MNEPQEQHHTTRKDSKDKQLDHISRLMPLVDVRPLIRRMYKSRVDVLTIKADDTLIRTVPLGSFLGEIPDSWNYTPIETISRMYYGKTVGFKFRALVTLKGFSQPEYNNVDFVNIRFYYLPQNINTLTGIEVITEAEPNVAPFVSPMINSDCVPLPFQILEKESTTMSKVFEFVIPDTSFYKFMGSPNKFYNFDGNAKPMRLSQADFGTLLMQATNLLDTDVGVSIELFVALADETRFGFHTIAPPFSISKKDSYYLGYNDDNSLPAPSALNKYIYKGGCIVTGKQIGRAHV